MSVMYFGSCSMFPFSWNLCYCYFFRWSVLRKRRGDCRWHSRSSSTSSKTTQRKKFIKKEIAEHFQWKDWNWFLLDSSVSAIRVHSFSVKFNNWIKDGKYFECETLKWDIIVTQTPRPAICLTPWVTPARVTVPVMPFTPVSTFTPCLI